MKTRKKIVIIGGGAAGLMAAISAAKQGSRVTVLERNDKIGKKILATGNGRCNFSNMEMDETHFEGSVKRLFPDIYQQFTREDLIHMLNENGVLVKEKKGYFYPMTEQAATIVDFFRQMIERYQIEVLTDCLVKPKDLQISGQGIFIKGLPGKPRLFDSMILSCGGCAAPKTGSDGIGFEIAKLLGHHLVPNVPSLVQLKANDANCKAFSGVRADAGISLYIDGKYIRSEFGEVQLTDYGISGIVVFQLSRYACYALKDKKRVKVVLDFLTAYKQTSLEEMLIRKWDTFMQEGSGEISAEMFFGGLVNKKLTMVFLKKCGLKATDPCKKISHKNIKDFVRICKNYEMEIVGSNGYDQAQVCAGGISGNEITPKLASKFNDRVFYAGEILDIDGKCGGYNLQWAFSSGYCAGRNASV